MILRSQLTSIGHIAKTHGIKGEVVVVLDMPVEFESVRCVVLDIDGIFVPFFIGAVRPRGAESVLLTFDDVNDEKEAAELVGKTVYALSDELPEDDNEDDEEGFYLSDLVGFTAVDDSDGSEIGRITDFDDSTANVLLIITSPEGQRLLVPAVDEFFSEIDVDGGIARLNIPKELITIQQ